MSILNMCAVWRYWFYKVYLQNADIHASGFCRFVVVPRLACPSASSLWWSAASDWDDMDLQAEKAAEKDGALELQVSFVIDIILLIIALLPFD